jgi:hypothetical protein
MVSDDFEIGFGRPPKRNQFRKGVSGNPKGRPKGSPNLATVLARALQEKVIVGEKGRRKSVTKLDAAVKQLVDQAASGDLAATRQLMALAGATEDQLPEVPAKQVTETDQKIMRSVLNRLKGCSEEDEDEVQ